MHAIGFSDKNELKGLYADTTRETSAAPWSSSCFSFTEIAKRAAALMNNGGSMLTLTYNGSQRVIPNYNVMGVAKAALEASVRYLAADYGPNDIRVNAISAGPVRTLAGAGISDARAIYSWNQKNAPLRRTATIEDIGGSALYLLSDLSRGVTGEIHYVDAWLQHYLAADAGAPAQGRRGIGSSRIEIQRSPCARRVRGFSVSTDAQKLLARPQHLVARIAAGLAAFLELGSERCLIGQAAIGNHQKTPADTKRIRCRLDEGLAEARLRRMPLMEGRVHDDEIVFFLHRLGGKILPEETRCPDPGNCGRGSSWRILKRDGHSRRDQYGWCVARLRRA